MDKGIIKIPRLVRYFLFCYIGLTSVFLMTNNNTNEDILYHIVWNVSLALNTSLMIYGLISIIEDLRKIGIKGIILKIRRFFYV